MDSKQSINEAIYLKLNILFLQSSPCIRNYKMATALRQKGHKVTLAYTNNKLSQVYSGLSDDTYNNNIQITSYRQLWDISSNYDLIHSHNAPDELTVAALGCSCPVIHDTHDLISLRDTHIPSTAYFEGLANRASHGRIATTSFQEKEITKLYGPTSPSIVFNNYASEGDLPKKFHPKLSAKDGEIHFVYEGGLGGSIHRQFEEIFINLAVRGVHVHIYPSKYTEKIAAFFSRHKNIHYNKPISPRKLIEEMTRYDFGIIPWNLTSENHRFLNSTMANKLFEYLAAGLPVATSPLSTYKDFFKEHKVGLTYNSLEELVENQIPILKEMAATVDFSKYIFTFEQQIHRIEEFYHKVLKNNVCM